jgi:hypothetical protein
MVCASKKYMFLYTTTMVSAIYVHSKSKSIIAIVSIIYYKKFKEHSLNHKGMMIYTVDTGMGYYNGQVDENENIDDDSYDNVMCVCTRASLRIYMHT